MFTKEHFEKVASILSTARIDCAIGSTTDKALDKLTDNFADIFAESNERFSRKAFTGACRAASLAEVRRLVKANNKRLQDSREKPYEDGAPLVRCGFSGDVI